MGATGVSSPNRYTFRGVTLPGIPCWSWSKPQSWKAKLNRRRGMGEGKMEKQVAVAPNQRQFTREKCVSYLETLIRQEKIRRRKISITDLPLCQNERVLQITGSGSFLFRSTFECARVPTNILSYEFVISKREYLIIERYFQSITEK